MAQDEHPRPQTTLEQMAKMPTVFKKGGTVTAANASVSVHVRTMLKRLSLCVKVIINHQCVNG